jgi:hypothetical protein
MVLRRDGYTTTGEKAPNDLSALWSGSGANDNHDLSSGTHTYARLIVSMRPAAKQFLPFFCDLMKSKLVLAGKSQAEIACMAMASALDKKELPPLAPGSIVLHDVEANRYLNDRGKNWHPHVMFYVSGWRHVKSWGANLQGSPVMSGV